MKQNCKWKRKQDSSQGGVTRKNHGLKSLMNSKEFKAQWNNATNENRKKNASQSKTTRRKPRIKNCEKFKRKFDETVNSKKIL